MPELPEVETVRQILLKQITGKTIQNIKIYYNGILENVTPNNFVNSLVGETICDIKRYGKYLFFILENFTVVSHLRMEGKFFIKHFNEEVSIHEHVVFVFTDGTTLRYHDTRKFGKMVLLQTTSLEQIMEYPSLKKLGLEANDPSLTKEYLYQKIKNKQVPIKTVLLDQTIISGLGNIYVDEVLHLCKLHPLTKACELDLEKCNEIVVASQITLEKAIKEGGTTIRSYTSSLGVTGRFQQHLLVHTKDTCFTCGNKVTKIFVGGRGTYYCACCQPQTKKVIGITGVIGSGKSAVCNYLINKGYQVIDSDKIVKKMYDSNALTKVIEDNFGQEYIYNNCVDKQKLGALIFNNIEKRKLLNSLVHPLVKKQIMAQINKSKEKLIFVDVPLLFEAHFEDLCDYIIVVYTNERSNVKRLMERNNISFEEAQIKIKSQMSIINKCYFADFIIDNSKDLCYTYERLIEVINMIK